MPMRSMTSVRQTLSCSLIALSLSFCSVFRARPALEPGKSSGFHVGCFWGFFQTILRSNPWSIAAPCCSKGPLAGAGRVRDMWSAGVLVIHVIIAFVLIGVVLLQRSDQGALGGLAGAAGPPPPAATLGSALPLARH